MTEVVEVVTPDPVAQAIAIELARALAAARWQALVAECAARGDV